MKIKSIILASIIFLFACGTQLTSPKRQSSYYYRQADRYLAKYGHLNNKIDTIIYHGKLQCNYRNGLLTLIGKIHHNQKIGVWYFFNDYGLAGVALPDTDSTWKPVILINQAW
jgi:hypothetical protein